MLATLVGIGTAGAMLGASAGTARASSTVIPQAGATGRVLTGRRGGLRIEEVASLLTARLGGADVELFTIGLSKPLQYGVGYTEREWTSTAVAGMAPASRVLARWHDSRDRSADAIAATQAALWHFTDGFDLDPSPVANGAAVIARYDGLLADAEAHPAPRAPVGELRITPPTSRAVPGSTIRVHVDGNAVRPWTVGLNDPAATAHPVTGDGSCDTAETLTVMMGPATICVTTAVTTAAGLTPPGPVSTLAELDVTVRSAGTAVDAGQIFVHDGRRSLVMADRSVTQAVVVAAISWDRGR